jgi:hypothetical protein
MKLKKIILPLIFFLVLGSFIFLPFLTNGALYNPIGEVTGEGDPDEMLVNLIANILNIVYEVVIGLSLIFIIIGGIMYMVASGNDEKMTRAKKMIIYAIIGLAIAIGAAVFLKEVAKALGSKALFTISGANMETTGSMSGVLEKTISLLLTSLGMLGIIGLIIGGFWYLHAGGDEQKAEIGKKTLTYSILGLIISIGSLVIVKQVAALF